MTNLSIFLIAIVAAVTNAHQIKLFNRDGNQYYGDVSLAGSEISEINVWEAVQGSTAGQAAKFGDVNVLLVTLTEKKDVVLRKDKLNTNPVKLEDSDGELACIYVTFEDDVDYYALVKYMSEEEHGKRPILLGHVQFKFKKAAASDVWTEYTRNHESAEVIKIRIRSTGEPNYATLSSDGAVDEDGNKLDLINLENATFYVTYHPGHGEMHRIPIWRSGVMSHGRKYGGIFVFKKGHTQRQIWANVQSKFGFPRRQSYLKEVCIKIEGKEDLIMGHNDDKVNGDSIILDHWKIIPLEEDLISKTTEMFVSTSVKITRNPAVPSEFPTAGH